MFALISLEQDPLRMSLKCEPEKAIELEKNFGKLSPDIIPIKTLEHHNN